MKLANSLILKIFNEIKDKNIYVVSHIKPDGDSIGSQIALTRILISYNIKAKAVIDNNIVNSLKIFINKTPFIYENQINSKNNYDLIAVDCANLSRISEKINQLFPNIILNIDHHISNNNYAKYNIVDAQAASTTAILTKIFLNCKSIIDPITAEALYLGIMTDSGQFSYSSTNSNLLRIAAKLIDLKANPNKINTLLYQKKSFTRIKILINFLSTLKLELNNQICIGLIDLTLNKLIYLEEDDLHGFINYTRNIKNVKIGALIEEKDSNNIKVSLRSKEFKYRVDLLAKNFGGGGHPCAAGFYYKSNIQDFYEFFLNNVSKFLSNIKD